MPVKRLARRDMKAMPDETSQHVGTRRSMITHSGPEQDVTLGQGNRYFRFWKYDKYIIVVTDPVFDFYFTMQKQVARIRYDCFCNGIGTGHDI